MQFSIIPHNSYFSIMVFECLKKICLCMFKTCLTPIRNLDFVFLKVNKGSFEHDTHNDKQEQRLLENNNLFAIMKVQKQCNVMSI